MEWLKIDQEEFRSKYRKKATINGVDALVWPSPYDIPEAITAYLSEDQQNLVVEFRYLSEETDFKTFEEDDLIQMEVGANSLRPYRILFSFEKLREFFPGLPVKEALESALSAAMKMILRRTNIAEGKDDEGKGLRFEIPQNAFHTNRDTLLRNLYPRIREPNTRK